MRKFSLLTAFIFCIILLAGSTFSKEPGDIADNFTLSSTQGASYTLYDELNSGKNVVVMFWSIQCPFVQPYHQRAKDLYNDFTSKGFTFWAINSNVTESMEDVAAHAASNGYPFPVLKDSENKVADLFNAQRTPEVFVISKDKVILYHGRIDDNKEIKDVTVHDLKNALGEISDGKDVSVKITKFFGCTIKRAGQDN
jgi:peroxiredoxin